MRDVNGEKYGNLCRLSHRFKMSTGLEHGEITWSPIDEDAFWRPFWSLIASSGREGLETVLIRSAQSLAFGVLSPYILPARMGRKWRYSTNSLRDAKFKTTSIRINPSMPQIEHQQEIVTSRPNTPKGGTTIAHILEQTKNIMSESGFAAISIRNVADRCNLSPGNVTYYFKTKEILLEELAKYIFDRWNHRFYEKIPRFVGSPQDIFVFSIEYMIEENKRPKTSNMLLEMWAMSNHNPAVRSMMDVFYCQMRSWIETLIQDMNPQMSKATRQKRAALFTAQIEGLMVLIGHGRIPHEELAGLEKEAVAQITHLAFLD